MNNAKLDDGQKHILRLIARDKKPDGWTSISQQLFKMVSEDIPPELATFEKLDVGGRAKLTDAGQGAIDAMEWLS